MRSDRGTNRGVGLALALAVAAFALPARAQQFTTAEEVKPILEFTRAD